MLMLYFLRHGQTEFSRDDNFCGSGLDPELTADGRATAAAFAGDYGSFGWVGVFASPLKRTIETSPARGGRDA